MGWKKEGGGGKRDPATPTPTSKKKNETSTPVHTAQIKIHVFGTHKLKEIKKERGGGIMGRCFYHHLAGKTAGNVKKRTGLVISHFFVLIHGIWPLFVLPCTLRVKLKSNLWQNENVLSQCRCAVIFTVLIWTAPPP